eukprot:5470619-Amphidinium_carterae.1
MAQLNKHPMRTHHNSSKRASSSSSSSSSCRRSMVLCSGLRRLGTAQCVGGAAIASTQARTSSNALCNNVCTQGRHLHVVVNHAKAKQARAVLDFKRTGCEVGIGGVSAVSNA